MNHQGCGRPPSPQVSLYARDEESCNHLDRRDIVNRFGKMNRLPILNRACMLLLGVALSPCAHSLPAAPVPFAGKIAIDGLNWSGTAAFTFALRDDNGTILVDSLGFESNDVRMEVRPGRGEVVLTDDGGATVELADTTIELPNEEVTITGVAGVVRCDSIDPLKILDLQELSFAKATYGDLHWGPGKIGFTLDENGPFALARCEGDFLGGTLGMEPTEFALFADDVFADDHLPAAA